MRALGVFALVSSLWVASSMARAEDSAYRATVQTDEAFVVAGPGADFYPTAKLHRGDEVEVYRQESGGWCAIRPPQGSFSYVNALNLTTTGPRVATVTGDRVPARVGSSLGEQRDAIHVYLKQGETVELLDTIRDPASGETWCKIAPPAGEFRWIHSKCFTASAVASAQFSSAPPSSTVIASKPTASSIRENAEPPSRYDVKLDVIPAVEPAKSDIAKVDAVKVVPGTVLLTGGTSEGWVAVDGGQRIPVPAYSTPDLPGNRGLLGAPGQQLALANGGPPAAPPLSVAMQYDLDHVDLVISKIVTQDPSRWEFTALRQQTDALFDHAANAGERAAVRAMLNKIDRYDDIHKRNLEFNQARDSGNFRYAPPTAGNPGSASLAGPAFPSGYGSNTPTLSAASVSPNPSAAPPGTFDSVGRLTPVHSSRAGAPGYALINPRNEVVTFITPSPGVDLQPFVGREIGVNGQRGYIPEFNRPHLTAQRAVVLR